MFSPKKRTKPAFPAPRPSDLICECWLRTPPFQTGSQGLCGGQSCGQPGLEGTEAHSHPQGKLRGKQRPTSPLRFPWEQKQSQNQKAREPQTLPAAADEESHFGKYLSKTKTKQKPNKMVV